MPEERWYLRFLKTTAGRVLAVLAIVSVILTAVAQTAIPLANWLTGTQSLRALIEQYSGKPSQQPDSNPDKPNRAAAQRNPAPIPVMAAPIAQPAAPSQGNSGLQSPQNATPPDVSSEPVHKMPPSPVADNQSGRQPVPPVKQSAPPSSIFQSLSFELLQAREASPDGFPLAYLQQKLEPFLDNVPARAPHLRVAVAFIEPLNQRASSYGGPIGYIIVALPQLSNCSRRFGESTQYRATDTATGMRLAVNDQVQSIADWILEAATKEPVQCPNY